MNANELANDMENGKFNDANYNRKKAADFVRQQQAELNSLRSVVYWLKENRPEVWDDIKKWSKM